MNKWVLLQPGEQLPQLEPERFVCLAMAPGKILRVMYRFVKNIQGHIAGYLILDNQTPTAPLWQSRPPVELTSWARPRPPYKAQQAQSNNHLNLH